MSNLDRLNKISIASTLLVEFLETTEGFTKTEVVTFSSWLKYQAELAAKPTSETEGEDK